MTGNFEIGMVTEVEGITCKVATFDNMNHSIFINNGEVLYNPKVNSFILINNGFEKIVGRINSETIWEQHSGTTSFDFDDRFSNNKIKRILDIEVIGTYKNSKFHPGITNFPMIGNVCVIPSKEVINSIYMENSDIGEKDTGITIGNSINENFPIELSVNSFFASHIGIFGNTGSGKSNTLHKLYYELFQLAGEYSEMLDKSKYIVIDFNGEYSHFESFGITDTDIKKVYEPGNNDNGEYLNRLPLNQSTFLDLDLLSILFSATTQTQRPFLGRVINGIKKYGSGSSSLARYVGWIIKELLRGSANANFRNDIVEYLIKYFPDSDMESALRPISEAEIHTGQEIPKFIVKGKFVNHTLNSSEKICTNYDEILDIIQNTPLNFLKEFQLRCHLENLVNRYINNGNPEFIVHMLNRVDGGIDELINILDITDNEELIFDNFLTIISLNKLRGRARQLIAMLISKMVYDRQKENYSHNISSVNLIIDEAHNILSYNQNQETDSGMDYRLSLFEEIVKEGRKFGFFITLSSQRPSDISPTIISQIHNFFIHKLVNERDLQIIDYSLSTLDRTNKSRIPTLSAGACIVSGTALNMALLIKVELIKEKNIRPQSDTINLVETWMNHSSSQNNSV